MYAVVHEHSEHRRIWQLRPKFNRAVVVPRSQTNLKVKGIAVRLNLQCCLRTKRQGEFARHVAEGQVG